MAPHEQDEDNTFDQLLDIAAGIGKSLQANTIRPHLEPTQYPPRPANYVPDPFDLADLVRPPKHGHVPSAPSASKQLMDELAVDEAEKALMSHHITNAPAPSPKPSVDTTASKAPDTTETGAMADVAPELVLKSDTPKQDAPAKKASKKAPATSRVKAVKLPRKQTSTAVKAQPHTTPNLNDTLKVKAETDIEKRFIERQKRLQDILNQDKGKLT